MLDHFMTLKAVFACAKRTKAAGKTERALTGFIRNPALAHRPVYELRDVTDALTFCCGSALAPPPQSRDHTATAVYHYSSLLS